MNLVKILFKNSNLFKKNYVSLNNIQLIGGSKKLTIEYNLDKYKFKSSDINEDYYVLYSKDEKECVSVIISKKDNIAEIHSIGNFDSCLHTTNQNVGSTLLQLTIKMLKRYKDKFKIKMIILVDNSIKKCGKKNIKFSIMKTLLTGDTWYGNYGFRPIKIENNKYIFDKINITPFSLKNGVVTSSLKLDIS